MPVEVDDREDNMSDDKDHRLAVFFFFFFKAQRRLYGKPSRCDQSKRSSCAAAVSDSVMRQDEKEALWM